MSFNELYNAKLEAESALTALERLGLRRDWAFELVQDDAKIDVWLASLTKLRSAAKRYHRAHANFERAKAWETLRNS